MADVGLTSRQPIRYDAAIESSQSTIGREATNMSTPELLSTGQVADLLGMQTWRIQQLYKRELVPEPRRCGRWRMFAPEDIPIIREAAQKAGYLKPPTA